MKTIMTKLGERVALGTVIMSGLFTSLRAQPAEEPFYAPPEAWLPGEKLPYFGSENPWNRRFFSEKPPRIGQPQYLALTEGRIADALALCRTRLAADEGDVESHLVLALAHGLAGESDAANAELETALGLGLPPERLLADRSALMLRLHAAPAWQRVARASNNLIHGPMLGAMTTSGCRVWVRTGRECEVEVRVSQRGDFDHPEARATGRTSAVADFTGTVELAGLQPGTRYAYAVWLDGVALPRGEDWEFRTFPPPAAGKTVRIAFGGCAKYFPPHERMWDMIRGHRPDAFLILGDNVYIDLPQSVGPVHDYTYHQRQSRPEFRRLTAGVPTFAIWDDHDAGIDDVFLGPYPDKPSWKVEHLAVFNRNWVNPPSGAPPHWPGVWHSFRIGDVEVFMLDGRYYRENYLIERPSMLGPVQKAWLLDGLKRSTATFKLLVSPVAWADDAKIDFTQGGQRVFAKDIWSGYRQERDEIFAFLAAERISGVLLVSSDRHRNDVRQIVRPQGYPLLEFESGWLTNEAGHDGSGEPLFQHLAGPAFQLFTFEGSGGGAAVTAEIITIDGEPVFRRRVQLGELTQP
ncbi:MAG TPA: alkaline phosphatase D family protein [Lacunisphaera sp.]